MKYIIYIILIILLSFVGYGATTVSDCINITSPGEYIVDTDCRQEVAVTTCINITASDVDFDCDNHIISSVQWGDKGFYVEGDNVSIRNCNVLNFSEQLYTKDIVNFTMDNFNFTSTGDEVMRVYGTDYSNFSNFYGQKDIQFWDGSSYNNIVNFTLDSSTIRTIYISADNSNNNTFHNFNVTGGILRAGGTHDGTILDCGGGWIRNDGTGDGVDELYNMTLQNCEISNFTKGIEAPSLGMYYNITIYNTTYGLWIDGDDAIFKNFTIYNSTLHELHFTSTPNGNIVSDFRINSRHTGGAVYLASPGANKFENSTVTGNKSSCCGVLETYYGIHAVTADFTGFNVTNVSFNKYDGGIYTVGTSNLRVTNSSCADTAYCLFLDNADSNQYHDIDCHECSAIAYLESTGGAGTWAELNNFSQLDYFYSGPINNFHIRTFSGSRNNNFTGITSDEAGFGLHIAGSGDRFNCDGGMLKTHATQSGFRMAGANNIVSNCIMNRSWDCIDFDVASNELYNITCLNTRRWDFETGISGGTIDGLTVNDRNSSSNVIYYNFGGGNTVFKNLWINQTGTSKLAHFNPGFFGWGATQNVKFHNMTVYTYGSDDVIVASEDNDGIDINHSLFINNKSSGSIGIDMNGVDTVNVYDTTVLHFDTGIDIDASVTWSIINQSTFCYSGTTDAADASANTWDNNNCNIATGSASCANDCNCSPSYYDWTYNCSKNCSFDYDVLVDGTVTFTEGSGFGLFTSILQANKINFSGCTDCKMRLKDKLILKK